MCNFRAILNLSKGRARKRFPIIYILAAAASAAYSNIDHLSFSFLFTLFSLQNRNSLFDFAQESEPLPVRFFVLRRSKNCVFPTNEKDAFRFQKASFSFSLVYFLMISAMNTRSVSPVLSSAWPLPSGQNVTSPVLTGKDFSPSLYEPSPLRM